jgi:hypothetical protein
MLWSYHVNMRLEERNISRAMILQAVDSLEVVEWYPEDKYFPSLLLRCVSGQTIFHLQAGLDVGGNNSRIVTAYRPDPGQWDEGMRVRRRQQ